MYEVFTIHQSLTMYNPAHPGEILKELYLEPLGLSVKAAAEGLGISRQTLSSLINQRSAMTPLMALRLSLAFPNTQPQFWLNLQNQFDLFGERENQALATVRRLAAA